MSTFTRNEIFILTHRLEVPDALCEALTDTHPDDPPAAFTVDEVEAAIENVTHRLRGDDWSELTPCQIAVLVDCVAGSTWFPVAEGHYEGKPNADAMIGRVAAQLERLAEKVSKITGEAVEASLF